MYKKIMLALDMNDREDFSASIDTALHLADGATELHVVSVVPNLGLPMVGQFFPEGYEDGIVKQIEISLSQMVAADLKPRTQNPVQQVVRQGVVYDEVLQYAREAAIDLIIIHSHKPNLKDYLLGPNAARVVRHADCSVMVLRDG